MQPQLLDGRYQIDQLLGDGGMARVYLGRDLRLNRQVAIKIPHPHIVADADFLARFRHEAHAAAIVSHPNLVDVYDVGQDGDTHYIVMEYVAGTDLKRLINRAAPLEIARAVRIGEQIARGLHAAHRAGLIHRDIKPQNVIVTDDGQARVTDFGVAKSHLSTALTETGISLGTVDYIAPEQAQGRPATSQSDIYALGVVLYELLTGRLPFSGETPVAVVMKHISEPPLPPRQLNPQIPAALEAIVLRALAKDPARRQRSALELADDLASYGRMVSQETMVNPALEPAPRPAPRPAPTARPANGTGQVPMLSPRATPARAARQEGLGCGVFLVGLLLLAGVLAGVLVISTGALNGIFTDGGRRPTAPAAVVTPAPEQTLTPTGDPTVAVPSLGGLSDGAAQELLRQSQLTPAPRGEQSSTVPQGIVIGQDVPPGTQLTASSPVSYTVSLGPLLVVVPDVVGTSGGIARSQLAAAGLGVSVVEEPSVGVDAGFVVRQSPSAGLRIPQGETVTVVVSVGDVVRLPDLIGRGRAEAEALLAATPGLLLVFVDEQGRDRLPDFDRYAPGEVVSAAREVPGGLAGVSNGDLLPRGSRVVLGVRADE